MPGAVLSRSRRAREIAIDSRRASANRADGRGAGSPGAAPNAAANDARQPSLAAWWLGEELSPSLRPWGRRMGVDGL